MKKIMFNDRYGLTAAVLEGRKTMTRRAVPDKTMKDALAYQSHHIDEEKSYDKYILDHAQYKVGEVVSIAQAYKDVPPYKEDEEFSDFSDLQAGWNNKMFVSAAKMPHHIKITDIKVERLQDISDKDCLKEGIDKAYLGYYVNGLRTRDWEKESHVEKDGKTYRLFPTPQDAFAALIDKVSGKGTWESNPWVFCYEFELID